MVTSKFVPLLAECHVHVISLGGKEKQGEKVDSSVATACSSLIPFLCWVFSSEDLTLGLWQVTKEIGGEISDDLIAVKFPDAVQECSEQYLLPILELNVSKDNYNILSAHFFFLDSLFYMYPF